MHRNRPHTPAAWRNDRGLSEVIAYVLIFSLVVSVVGLVTVTGFNSLTTVRDAQQATNAERAFDVLADNVEDLYEQGAPSRATEINLADASLSTTSTVTMNVTATDTSDGSTVSFEQTARPIAWRGETGTEIVYSFGAILRDDNGNGAVLEPPPFQLDSERTVIPILGLRAHEGQQFSGTTIRIRAERGSSMALLADPAPNYNATLNITSPRAESWDQYLSRKPDTDCTVVTNPAGETAVCELSEREELHITLTRITIDLEG